MHRYSQGVLKCALLSLFNQLNNLSLLCLPLPSSPHNNLPLLSNLSRNLLNSLPKS
jgi:hypothetical protein